MPGSIEAVQQAYTEVWMAIPGVVGTAIGRQAGEPCIVVMTAADADRVREQIPTSVEGYRVVIQHTGEFRALDDSREG